MPESKQIVLVTGASSGIGLATAEALLARGHTVYGAARRVERMAHLGARGGHALELDVTDDASMEAAVQTILDAEGRIDALVNNAGYGSYGAVEDVPIDEARRQFEVNLFGLARMIQLVLPSMRARKAGTIVNVSSMGGKIYFPLGAWYHATKHALEGFSDSLRLELAPHGVDVVIVEPGSIATEWSDIAVDHMEGSSDDGPYADLTGKMSRLFNASEGSPPTVIADVIVQAVEADKPKTRYVAGAHARTLLTARALLPDRAFDALISSQLK